MTDPIPVGLDAQAAALRELAAAIPAGRGAFLIFEGSCDHLAGGRFRPRPDGWTVRIAPRAGGRAAIGFESLEFREVAAWLRRQAGPI